MWYAWETGENRTRFWLGNLNKNILKPLEDVGRKTFNFVA